MESSINPEIAPDGRVVFKSYDDLQKWVAAWAVKNRHRFEYKIEEPEPMVARDAPAHGERRDELAGYCPKCRTNASVLVLESHDDGAPGRVQCLVCGVIGAYKKPRVQTRWTPALVREFLTSIGKRSRDLAKDVVRHGIPEMLAKEFGEKIDSSVTGLGKRFAKLERDAAEFSKTLPSPARLGGPQGERVLEVDPSFETALRELWQSGSASAPGG